MRLFFLRCGFACILLVTLIFPIFSDMLETSISIPFVILNGGVYALIKPLLISIILRIVLIILYIREKINAYLMGNAKNIGFGRGNIIEISTRTLHLQSPRWHLTTGLTAASFYCKPFSKWIFHTEQRPLRSVCEKSVIMESSFGERIAFITDTPA